MFAINIYKNGECMEYTCRDYGWKDSTTLVINISKIHVIRVSLLNADRIEIKEIDE